MLASYRLVVKPLLLIRGWAVHTIFQAMYFMITKNSGYKNSTNCIGHKLTYLWCLDWHLFVIWLAVEQEEDVWDNLIIASARGNQCTTQGSNVSEGRLNFCKIWFAQIAILSFICIIARPCNLNFKFLKKIQLSTKIQKTTSKP